MAEPPPHHTLTIDRTLGALHLHADLPLTAPWTLLFGPSGSGKSTLLRAAAGLLGSQGIQFSRRDTPDAEQVLIGKGIDTPSHRLGLAYAPQGGVLFPHLNVAENIRFAASLRRIPNATQTDDLLQIFEVVPLTQRMPRLLSGGERQRVNLARAFAVPDARLLLLDEPFTGMGRELRDRLLERVLSWTRQRGIPVLSVSHDVDEALLLQADVVVLEEGRILRRGPAAQALAAERTQLLQSLRA